MLWLLWILSVVAVAFSTTALIVALRCRKDCRRANRLADHIVGMPSSIQ